MSAQQVNCLSENIIPSVAFILFNATLVLLRSFECNRSASASLHCWLICVRLPWVVLDILSPTARWESTGATRSSRLSIPKCFIFHRTKTHKIYSLWWSSESHDAAWDSSWILHTQHCSCKGKATTSSSPLLSECIPPINGWFAMNKRFVTNSKAQIQTQGCKQWRNSGIF